MTPIGRQFTFTRRVPETIRVGRTRRWLKPGPGEVRIQDQERGSRGLLLIVRHLNLIMMEEVREMRR